MSDNNVILIMAGGLGKRMNSNLPKVLHTINNKPMILYIIEASLSIKPHKIIIVVGKYKNIIQETINKFLSIEQQNYIEYVYQDKPNGTGDAIIQSKYLLKNMINKNLLILCGDTPLIDKKIINNMFNKLNNIKLCITELTYPTGYGRIINYDNYTKIVEEKECTDIEKQIKIINCGLYAIKIELLLKYIDLLSNNNSQNEYYLTDIVEIITKNENINIEFLEIEKNNNYKVFGVNNQEQLKILELNYFIN